MKPEENAPLSTRKRVIFTVITLLIPVMLLGALELGLRWMQYGGDLNLFKRSAGFGGGALYVPNPNYAARYFVNIRLIPTPSRDAFLAEKPANGLRIFVMGESTTAGYPYGFNGTFSRVVRDALGDVLPADTVEVINMATSAVNSYTVWDQVDEILRHQPDAVMIYLGHNEFYGALGVASSESLGAFPGFVRFYLKLQQFRTFLWLRDTLGQLLAWFAPERSGTLMEQVVREQIIPLDSELYQLGLQQFESNLRLILKKYLDAGVPVFIASVASNVRDQAPFESTPTADKTGKAQPLASEIYAEAQALMAQGDTTSARPLFLQAKNLDALRFRASDDINTTIRQLADEYGAVYVPVLEAFEANSPGRLIGKNLMLEHLHPNADGYHLMGRTFFEAIAAQGYLGRKADSSLLAPWSEYRRRMYLSEFDERAVAHRLMLLMQAWPFVKQATTDYRQSYVMQGRVDSSAYHFVNGDLTWDQAKVALANWYEKNGQYDRALLEYLGLMRDQPHNDSPKLFAARIYLDFGYYQEAYPLLKHAYAIEPSAYGTKMLGALEVDRGNLDEGIRLLEQSLQLKANDAQTYFNLAGAWALKSEYDKALDNVRKAEQLNPNFPGLQDLKRQLESL
jgi:lysophospholipase L1-like esterase